MLPCRNAMDVDRDAGRTDLDMADRSPRVGDAVGKELGRWSIRDDDHSCAEHLGASRQLAMQVKHIDCRQIAAAGHLNFDEHGRASRVRRSPVDSS